MKMKKVTAMGMAVLMAATMIPAVPAMADDAGKVYYLNFKAVQEIPQEQVQEITQVQHLTLAKQSALYPEKMDPVQEAHLSSCSVSKKKMQMAIKWITQPKMPV